MKNEPTVYIVDDEESIRKALSFLMKTAGVKARTYASAEEFLQAYASPASSASSGCLLLDVRMPGMDGLELQSVLNKKQIKLPVIIITGHADIRMAVQAMRAGAVDFIEKPFDPELLLQRVQECMDKSKNIRKKHDQHTEIAERLASLSKREREVMQQLVEGKANKVIAAELYISARTVEVHRARVMSKLQAKSLSDVVRIAMMVQDDPPLSKT
ncbi:MAG: response regulator transcription factor [Gammaproteobacteria bacterium]|nr:response regulator transcription factor [Gammaproteobacteria bacterium]